MSGRPPVIEHCPHCGRTLDYDPEIGYRMSRLLHLLDHALYHATNLRIQDFPDRLYWDIASECEDSWEDIALTARGMLFDLIDSAFGPTITEKERDNYERKAIRWLKSKYPSAFRS